MKKLLLAAAAALALLASPALADDKAGGCENCAHHKAMKAQAEGAKATAEKPAVAEAACACKSADAKAPCKCAEGKCACAKAAGHETMGHDCANCPHHKAEKAAKGETRT